MCLFIESIKIKDRKIYHVDYHNERMHQTRKKWFAVNDSQKINLSETLLLPSDLDNRLYKCRIVFNKNIHKIEFIPYQNKTIRTLKLIDGGSLDYTYKFLNRERIDDLYNQRGDCDDILIIKNGLLTDTSSANIVLFNGEEWFTPRKPLLAGTHRARLLEIGKLKERDIAVKDINHYSRISLINALMDLNEIWIDKVIN